MKKLLLSLLTFSFAVAASAQDQVEIYIEGQTTDISSGNGVYQVDVTTNDQVHPNLVVKNISGSAQTWGITRYRINENATWSDYLCWYDCYSSSLMSTNPWTTPSNGTVTVNDQSTHTILNYITPGDAATVTYRYYVTSGQGGYIDSADVVISSTLSVTPLTKDVALSVSPNPASNVVNVTTSGVNNATLTIVDVLGNVVLKEEISESRKVDVSEFNNGIYFVTVNANGSKTISRKFIVRH